MLVKSKKPKLIVFDVDCTLTTPLSKSFYGLHSQQLIESVKTVHNVGHDKAAEIIDFYKQNFVRGEYAIFNGDAHTHFPELAEKAPDYQVHYNNLSVLEPYGLFPLRQDFVDAVRNVRAQGVKTVALSNSPDILVYKQLQMTGFDVTKDFDAVYSYLPDTGAPKMIDAKAAFSRVAKEFGLKPKEILSIGDTYGFDIKPAQELGMKTCMVENTPPREYKGRSAKSVLEALKLSL